ncbi:MAG: hypothetical protein OER87_16515, partial [Gammaproteobacteria bacterium]|nr:hypothetical protein [Gammaproteobacteria bacterium]
MIFRTFGKLVLLALSVSLTPVATLADSLQAPTGKVILTVSGKIANTNAGDRAEFDREMLEALGDSELA